MTKIKLCGLSANCDIEIVNELEPEYIGFVFAPQSKRYVSPQKAAVLKKALSDKIKAVGVFVNEQPRTVAKLLNDKIIDMAQLHGDEDEAYIRELRKLTDKPIIKAFRIQSKDEDIVDIENSSADYVLLDSGAGTGNVFDWKIIQSVKRPYFLAGGLSANNVKAAIEMLNPYAVDVSSGIEVNGRKDKEKTEAFVAACRRGERL